MMSPLSGLGPVGRDYTSINRATTETMSAAAGLPGPLAERLTFGLGIAQWADRPQNQDVMNQPEFINAYNQLFAPGQDQITNSSGFTPLDASGGAIPGGGFAGGLGGGGANKNTPLQFLAALINLLTQSKK